jgi:hypothetical protein
VIGRFSPFRALTEEGQPRLDGAVLADAFSREAGELVPAFERGRNGKSGRSRKTRRSGFTSARPPVICRSFDIRKS